MSTYSRTFSAITYAGVVIFVVVVALLQLAQPGYEPSTQFMSELALGNFGGFFFFAFLGLAAATAATAANIHTHNSAFPLVVMLGLAAACFLGAGMITLATSTQTHVLLVAAAFVLCGLCMYLLPLTIAAFSGVGNRIASWGSCAVMVTATALGDIILPGIAQRLSAAALLFWLSLVAWCLARSARCHQ